MEKAVLVIVQDRSESVHNGDSSATMAILGAQWRFLHNGDSGATMAIRMPNGAYALERSFLFEM